MKKIGREDEILGYLVKISEDVRSLRARMVSLESWMAALSKGKDLPAYHTFAKNITNLADRLHPTMNATGEKSRDKDSEEVLCLEILS